jgi:DNA processing protein
MLNDLKNNSTHASKLERIAFTLYTNKNQKARKNILKRNIGPRQLPALSTKELELLGFSTEEACAVKSNYIPFAEKEMETALNHNIHIIFQEDNHYPALLRETFDPPDFIYALGNIDLLNSRKLAVVGSRKATAYGWTCINHLLPDLCTGGLTIVSGMAYGIDSMAHKVTIKEKGNTIGVNAGGLLHLYPAGNKGLIDEITEKGCIISEFALDIVPRPFYFPIRNRVIAGISNAILVIEAALKSGSLITARLGLEQNRDIFAIPGRIDSSVSHGTNYLIQNGAKLITSSRDILEEFGIILETVPQSALPQLTKNESKIIELMAENEITSLDFLVERLDMSVAALISQLMALILKSIVIEDSGGYRRVL